jgi:hypothetical protein
MAGLIVNGNTPKRDFENYMGTSKSFRNTVHYDFSLAGFFEN